MLERVLATNVVGIVRVTQAFMPLLQRSREPGDRQRLLRDGLARHHERPRAARVDAGRPQYPASKAAVNMLTTQYAKALPEMRVNCVDPGYTATDFNRTAATRPSSRAPT